MLKNIPFFKKPGYRAEVLPFLVFRSVMIAMQIICVVVVLFGTFYVILNNVGESREGPPPPGTLIKNK
ncbi:TPA: hypothetical protein G8N70_003104 [Salmonella enterica]|uniref:Uncharacterized protein n=1 Tax=Salmonella enterica TaxID=28901 RepID=A0A744CD70_SALER|nr:hypothetical protein [Salmonella enterica]HAF4919959.1 hypothetical protein [Salmonella enterica]